LSETAIAFARSCSCGSETAIAFAGAKWAFLVQFSRAVVMSVSTVPCWGRAVVLLVSMSPRCRALCAKKFALRAHNGPKLAFLGVLGEFFRANRCCAGLGCSAVHFRLAAVGGFAALEAGWRRVAGVSYL